MPLEIHTFCTGPLGTNCHVVIDSSHRGWIFDAPPGVLPYLQELQKSRQVHFQALLLTHSHWDHISQAKEIKEAFGIPIYIHALDHPQLLHPGSDGVPYLFSLPGVSADHLVEDQQTLQMAEDSWVVLHTPGHSPGSVVYYAPQEGLMITGDTLFEGAYGRTDLATGNEPAMMNSLKRLVKMDPSIQFFPGHGPSSTLGSQTWLYSLINS